TRCGSCGTGAALVAGHQHRRAAGAGARPGHRLPAAPAPRQRRATERTRMNRRLLLLVLVLAVLGGIAWWLQQRSTATTLDAPLTDFAVPDTARVTRLFITDTKGHVSDVRREGDRWTVNGRYEARQPLVNIALKTLLRVEVRSPVPKSGEPMVLRTMAGTSTKVEIYEGGSSPSKVWIIGHATKDHFGTYLVLEKPG